MTMDNIDETQIRPCLVLFAEIVGLDRYASRMEPEEYAELLRGIFEHLDEAVLLYDGHVDKHKENVLMATFGAPRAHEDDPERALRTAILMLKKVEAIQLESKMTLQLRVGMKLGRVCAGRVGSSQKQDYTVMGDVVNTASRIMEQANPGEILVSEEVSEAAKAVFEFSSPVRFTYKGSDSETVAYGLLRIRSGFIRRRGIEGLQSALVGREREFRTLTDCIRELFAGRGSTVLIAGEAGVGKSRLIEEVFTHSLGASLENARVINWCTGRCSPYKERSYYAIIELIKQVCKIDGSDREEDLGRKLLTTIKGLMNGKSDEVYPYLANLFDLRLSGDHQTKVKHLEPKDLKLQTQLSISHLLKDYAQAQSTVYCIDDLHFADAATLETIKFVLETAPQPNALVILIARPESEKPFWAMVEELRKTTNLLEISLNRLTLSQTEEISRNLLKIPNLAATMVAEIVARSEGNPFFLEEIIKLLIARGVLHRRGVEWCATAERVDLAIPYTVEGIIRARFDSIEPDARDMLSEMAVIGRRFSKPLLSNVTRHWENCDALISRLTELGFIYPDNSGEYAFNHALLREVIYSSMLKSRQKDLHAMVGRAIESLYEDHLAEHCEVLFEHFRKAGDLPKAITYALRSGENAAKRYANDEAIFYYRAILDILDTAGDRPDTRRTVLESLGRVLSLTGKNSDALLAYEQALRLCTDNAQSAVVFRLLATLYEQMSEYDKAIGHYMKADDLLGPKPGIEKLKVAAGIGWIWYLRGSYRDAQRVLEHALSTVTDQSNREIRQALARIYNILGSVYSHTGRKDEAFTNYNRALKLYELLDDMAGIAVIYNNIHSHYTDQGDYYRGLEYLQKSHEIDVKTGNQLARAISTYNIGQTYEDLGDIDQAEQRYLEYLSINALINNRLGDGYGNWALGRVALERGQLEQASDRFDKAFNIFTRLASKVLSLSVRLSQSELAARQGRFEPAVGLCDQVATEAGAMNVESMLINARIQKAGIRLQQAVLDQSRRAELLGEAKSLLMGLDESIKSGALNQETIFEVYFYLSRISALLNHPDQARAYCDKARAVQQGILQFITDPQARERFLDQRTYREFADYSKRY